MKSKMIAPLCFLLLALAPASYGQIWDSADQTSKVATPAVVSVRAMIEIDFGEMAEMMGMAESSIKTTLSASGIVVHPNGGVVVATASIEAPDMPMFGPQGGPEALRTGLSVLFEGGKSFPAKVVSEDKELGLSFLQIEPGSTELFRSFTLNSVAPLALGDELLAFDRMSESFGGAVRATQLNVAGFVSKPMSAVLQQGAIAIGSAVFNGQGRFVGMTLQVPPPSADDGNPLAGLSSPEAQPIVIVTAKSIKAKLPKSMIEKKEAPKPSKKITDPSFLSADEDKNGQLDAGEFKAYASSRLSGQDEAFYTRLFKLVDTDSDNTLNVEEFKERMAAVRKAQSAPEPEAAKKEEAKAPRRKREAPSKRDLNDKEGDYDSASRRAAPRDAFPVFDNPTLSQAKDAKTSADEVIIGVVCDGEARAYPISIMGVHELGNDVCGKTPIAVSW
ncbi:MAG: hypothetical protein ACI97A_002996 [Planctomycetota bacterium]|jgi:hypothetical protein